MNKIRVSVIPVVALIFVSPAAAHHSDAGMDMESVIAFEGTVKEFASASPVSKQMLRKFFFFPTRSGRIPCGICTKQTAEFRPVGAM